jgi:hypothetical protein
MKYTQVQYKKYENLGWEFSDNYGSPFCFNYKSPRMKNFVHFLSESYNDIESELIKHEEQAYLAQLRWGIAKQTQHLQDDIMRQLEILIKRGMELPTELKVDLTIKIV